MLLPLGNHCEVWGVAAIALVRTASGQQRLETVLIDGNELRLESEMQHRVHLYSPSDPPEDHV